MVGAIPFLRDYVGICRRSRCSNCELHRRGVCCSMLQNFDDAQIGKAVAVVKEIKAKEAQDGRHNVI